MKKNSVTDYLACIIFKILGPIIRILPKRFGLWMGKKLGSLLYYFDLKHKSIAYANIKAAFGRKLGLSCLSGLTKEFYKTYGQNIFEVFFIPQIDKKYLNKYISIEGLDYIYEAFKKGKGVIMLGIHEGSWELSNIISANLNFPFNLFVRDQRHPRLNRLLNSYRRKKGCRIIERKNGIRQLVEAICSNEGIGMTVD